MGKKKNNPHLEKILSLEKMFDGIFHVDDIQIVYKECSYDLHRTISQLIERKNKFIQSQSQERGNNDKNENLEKLLKKFGKKVDQESLEVILRENGNDYEMASATIRQIYEIFEDDEPESIVHDPINELVAEYQSQIDSNIILALYHDSNNDINRTRNQLNYLLNENNQTQIQPSDPPTSPLLDSTTLVSLIRSSLQDFLPDDAVNQFVVHNFINESLTSTRLEFILNQIMLVVSTVSSFEEDPEDEKPSHDGNETVNDNDDNNNDDGDDILEVVLSQCDSDMIPVDWTFNSLELSSNSSTTSSRGQELSLLELLSFGNLISEVTDTSSLPPPPPPPLPSLSSDLNPIEWTRQVLNELNETSSVDQIISDEMILSTLEGNNYDTDATIVTLTRTLEMLQQEDSSFESRTSRTTTKIPNQGKKKNGSRTKVSYATVLQSEPLPDLFSLSLEESQSSTPSTSRPQQPWKPSIIVVPIDSNSTGGEVNLQSSHFHLEQEKYWRSIQTEQQKNISRLITIRSRDGARSIPSACHEISRAALEASKHALLARNPGLLIQINDQSLLFKGFHHSYFKYPTSRNSFEFSIDLHGVDVRNAIQFINSMIGYLNKPCPSSLSSSHSLAWIAHLVVGRGSHSKGGIAKLKPAIKSFLLRKGYRISVLESEITLFVEAK